jgi:Dyp-type peroxidase family
MKRELELADIQGIVINGYARAGFPKARHLFLHIADAAAGRRFLAQIFSAVTTSVRWPQESPAAERAGGAARTTTVKPKVTLNVGFTLYGLHALGVPVNTLRLMPTEFIEGMAARSKILGDVGDSAPEHWDPIWRESEGARPVHVWITLNAQMQADGSPVPELEERTAWLRRLCAESNGGVAILAGHAPNGGDYQEASAVLARDDRGQVRATPNEHFGFHDGIGNPVFDGQLAGKAEQSDVIGGGKQLADGSWRPLATGEFLLGYADEAQEIPPAPVPVEFSRNCTFMVYRKLHENVASFRAYIDKTAGLYQAHCGIPPGDEARETVMAKMAGRWSNGVPLMVAPTYRESQEFWERYEKARQGGDKGAYAALRRQFNDFKYRDDPDGIRCPMTAHVRRTNTRDMLDPESEPAKRTGSSLNDRRRILRRGLPYGEAPPGDASVRDDGDHGIIFIAFCASLFRQFEFVQQQWIQYGLDFNAGNDTCPLAGKHGADAKFVIPVDPESGRAPFICSGIPQFVTTRGGAYFFIPSITALRMIAMGVIDPT